MYLNFDNNFDTAMHMHIEKPKSKIKEHRKLENITNSHESNKQVLLNKNLKHLEFIAKFEMYLEQKTFKNFSVEFLQEFEQIKIEAQLSALKNTNQLNNSSTKMAA